MFSSQQFLLLLPLISTASFLLIPSTLGAGSLPPDEVEALREIAKTLGKSDWNFNGDPVPCSDGFAWYTSSDDFMRCNCSFSNDTVCHVNSISLTSQNLTGTLPPEIVRLPYLSKLYLSDNYLNGSIPEEWGSTQLDSIVLNANRLSGSIPAALANISTLRILNLDSNRLSGVLLPELGNLPKIAIISICSNNISGTLPETFAQLTTLKEFWISDNQFIGRIPNFIQNWKDIETLCISGPIPSGISALTNLTDLRISDLNGANASFPPLNGMTNMRTLILRSCNISGQLPEYLTEMTSLSVLDLSFNRLSGPVPSNYTTLKDVEYIYLTGNMLTGLVPTWMLEKEGNIDLSYNNFTRSSTTPSCQHQGVNLFASSSMGNNSGIVSCLGSLHCSTTRYFLHINCGGDEVTIDRNTTYDGDIDRVGPSSFVSKSNWALSNTGHFLDGISDTDIYVVKTNSSRLGMNNTQLYSQARISPISLTYYGFCLGNGSYTVNLHFAEIVFTNDQTYSSLGRRIFDVYIQGQRVLKDFNIEEEAGGVGIEVIKGFFNVSVTYDFVPPTEPREESTMAVGTVERWNGGTVGIIVAVAFVVVGALFGLLWWKGCLRPKSTLDKELRGLGNFSLRQIKTATNNFDIANKIGEGGFGSVYKGRLSKSTVIAVKMLSAQSKQGNKEFVNEIGTISAQQHPNLVKLYGCCTEGDQLLLVYEYLENNNLARALFGSEEHQLKLDWPTRHKICVGVARGIAYLHEESKVKIVHRDIKATNVLLDKELNPKISDFGLARLNEEENTHISTRIAGTCGYMAPEYAMRGYCTDKVDVYSFGIVVLEIVSGKSNTSCRPKGEPLYLLDWAHALKEEGNLIELVDQRLGYCYNEEQAMSMIKVAFLCTDPAPTKRPSMSSVVSMLEGQIPVGELMMESSASFATDKVKLEELKNHYQFSSKEHTKNSNTQSQSVSTEGPWTTPSTSKGDLYPINTDSEYLITRD